MASRTGVPDLPSSQPILDQNAAFRPTSSTRPPVRPVSPSARPTDHTPGVRSPLALASPQASRTSSPSRQWLHPINHSYVKDSAPSTSENGPALQQPTSSASGTSSSATAAQRPRSSVSPAAAQRPASLNDAVNKLWRLQKQQNGVSEGPSAHSPVSSPRRNSSSSVKQQDGEAVDLPSTRGRSGSEDHDSQEPNDHAPKNHSSSQSQNGGGSRPPRGFSGLPPTLETVEEGDHPVSSSHATGSRASSFSDSKRRSDAGQEQITSDSSRDEMSSFDGGDGTSHGVPALTPQRTTEENDKRLDARRDSASQSHAAAARRPHTSLIPHKVRASNDGPSRHMTVETETVSSIPQTSMGANPGERGSTTKRDEHGTLRLRPSNETIKPKKEKKKSAKKPTSIISGTTSSKADIFEAKVASAVDEDTSDSDETFVYESNPPEPRSRPNHHHSRTPSVTSMQSLVDRRGARTVGNLLDSHRRVRGKRSMKFASNPYNAGSMDEGSADGDPGTVRASTSRLSNSGDMQSKYKGLYSRGTGGYASPSESESPYSHAARVRSAHGFDTRHSPKPQSPTLGSPHHAKLSSRRGDSSPYDLEGERADDERAPLIASIRSQRTRGSPRTNDSSLQHLDYYPDNQRSCCSRCAGCTLMVITIVLVIMGAAAFLFATTKPLYEVTVREVQNVLASEQEIMLDLLVEATNPNIVAITISDMDVNVFAKSRHVRSDVPWSSQQYEGQLNRRGRGTHNPMRDRYTLDNQSQDYPHRSGGVDKGTDPMPEDPESDPQTMLLGRIFHFDSALMYDGSPLRQLAHNSTGEMRLQRPGNKTEEGGTERWENVIQHPFELIVRGILKYQLPLSSRTMTASIGASVIVHPEEEIDSRGVRKVEKVKRAS